MVALSRRSTIDDRLRLVRLHFLDFGRVLALARLGHAADLDAVVRVDAVGNVCDRHALVIVEPVGRSSAASGTRAAIARHVIAYYAHTVCASAAVSLESVDQIADVVSESAHIDMTTAICPRFLDRLPDVLNQIPDRVTVTGVGSGRPGSGSSGCAASVAAATG